MSLVATKDAVEPGCADYVTKLDIELRPDPMRTVIRPFLPSDLEKYAEKGHPRGLRIMERVLSLDPGEVKAAHERVRQSLDERHRNVEQLLLHRFRDVEKLVPKGTTLSHDQKTLIGAYFSAEYSYESAALFNPSIVPHPKQDDPNDGMRFVMSLRGIGEGHLSSVTFRTGCWAKDGAVVVDTPSETSVAPMLEDPTGWHDEETIQLDCKGSRDPSETVLFPIIDSQARGIEDVRLTIFETPDNPRTYAGTFTAFGDKGVSQQMIQTDDFRTFKMHPVHGELADSKGMAMFPRKIGGKWMALGRQDNENLWLFESDELFVWNGGKKLLEPHAPWEYVQIGNCGSPLEIDEGWLVLTHGVGVVRNYCMGAALLDKDNPSKVLGRLSEPMLEPDDKDRDGYVPNVVYSCGALVRDRALLLPYGVADNYTSFAIVDLDGLIGAMTAPDA